MASNNSSKTAHVMNLLSKNRGPASEPAAEPKAEAAAPQEAPAPQAEAAPQAAPAPQAEPARTAPVAPIISSITADAAVSSQIKDALEAELAEAPKAPPQPPVQKAEPPAAPAPQAASVQSAAPVQPAASAPIPEAPAAPVQEEPAFQEVYVEEAEKPAYINVMQLLVDEKADEYMKMFGICCCDKCRVDVRAYALNHLPPKYVVLSQNERVPRLTVYESRFSSDVTAQLIQACKKVMLTPHHSRPEA
jgi:hypothetical protein